MLKNVLAVARPPMHAADELDELRMQAMNPRLVRGRLADLEDLCVDFLARLVDDLFDAAWMNTSIRHELLEREARDLAANRIEAGDHHRVRRIVDDDIDSGRQLEGADVPAFPTDDAPLHLVVRKRYCRYRALSRVLGGDPLNGERDNLLCLALGVASRGFPDLANTIRRVGVRLLFHATDELRLRVLSRHARHLLEAPALFANQRTQLLFALHHRFLATAEFARATAEIAVALLEDVGLAIENRLALGDTSLLALDFLAAPAHFLLEFFAQLDELFLSADNCTLSKILSFALAIGDDSLGGLLGGRLRGGESLNLGGHSKATSEKEESRRGDDHNAKGGSENFIHMDLCSTAEWAAG